MCRWAPHTGASTPPKTCAAPNSLRLACGPCSCVNKAQNSHRPVFGAARQPHGRPGALVPPGASGTERGRRPESARLQIRCGWHAACAAQLRCIRTLAGPRPARRSSRTTSLAPGVIEPGALRWAWAPLSSAPARHRAACAAQLRCVGAVTCASPARCSSLTASLAPDVIMPFARGLSAPRIPELALADGAPSCEQCVW